MMACVHHIPVESIDDELLRQKCSSQQRLFHSIMSDLTDVFADCNNKFHTFLRNDSEWSEGATQAELDH
jgi:hypothetical protein